MKKMWWWIWRQTFGRWYHWIYVRRERRVASILRSRFIREELVQAYVDGYEDTDTMDLIDKMNDREIVEDFDLCAPIFEEWLAEGKW